MKINSELAKKSIESKLFILVFACLIFVFIVYKLDYDFSNMVWNSILLFALGFVIRNVLTFDSSDFYFDLEELNFQLDIDEYKAKEFELRLKYPKLYIYNQTVFYISLFIKLCSVLLFIYGSSKYIFN